MSAGWQRRAAIENADVVESQEAALENVHAFRILAIHPPGEIEHQFLENAFEKCAVSAAALFLFDFVNAPRGPGMHGRIHIAHGPFIGGQLAVGMHVPFAEEKQELLLGEIGVDQREGNAMESQVPRGEPRIFPFVRHGNYVGVVEMQPIAVAAVLALLGRRGLRWIAIGPIALSRSDKTVWTTAIRRAPGEGHCGRL